MFIIAMKDKRKDRTFEETQASSQIEHALVFSDEKNFYSDQMINSQNNRWLYLTPQDLLILMKTKHWVHIIVFGVITSDNDVIPPFIFPNGLRLNIKAYIKCLEEVMVSCIKRVTGGRSYIW